MMAKRNCIEDSKPCPPPLLGHGPGESQCEQNGICQRVDLAVAPRLEAVAWSPPKQARPMVTKDLLAALNEVLALSGRAFDEAAVKLIGHRGPALREMLV